jgi:hypothetical protein
MAATVLRHLAWTIVLRHAEFDPVVLTVCLPARLSNSDSKTAEREALSAGRTASLNAHPLELTFALMSFSFPGCVCCVSYDKLQIAADDDRT